ncbi:glycerol kinase [Spiroplasma clarkii]|uniref:Glycerol kinase n=1 Tax=Spiroplasma clarkii TaxID=2139 RepID=A0A1Y0KYQ0_9MOLU|nr:glycerol kinase GlpK [Spiroplasma clarkii]ARU90863.1 glycerol kinase [Spiroplasma clarkii]ATX71648.1 glycerol kinase [Spiroplasma clarkii]
MEKYILALDEGTTSARSLLVNKKGEIVALSQNEFSQIYPNAGWVEQDATEIWNTQRTTMVTALNNFKIDAASIEAIGITNQRETVIVWDKDTGNPIYNAIVWQDRRTDQYCIELAKTHKEIIKEKTGLVIDAYFSASKVKWILDNVSGAKEKAKKGELYFGNVNSWLIWKLTGGEKFLTDHTNASRTMLYNINTNSWDQELLDLFEIPMSMLPEIKSNSEIYGQTFRGLFSKNSEARVPICSSIGDQQSALFGQMCLEPGEIKATYGTGAFILMNTGSKKIDSPNGLLTVVSYAIKDKVTYGLEGSVMMAGATLQWLRDELRIIYKTPLSEWYAQQVNDDRQVYFVPSFSGLGSPYWDPYSRGAIFGLDRGVTKEHIIKAALESIAFQSNDVFEVMRLDSNIPIKTIKVDGGAANNNYLLQFQADITSSQIIKPKNTETTAMGAAYLAGLATGFWKDIEEIKKIWAVDKKLQASGKDVSKIVKGWKEAVRRTMGWLKDIA